MEVYRCRVKKSQIERRPLALQVRAVNGQNPSNDLPHSLICVTHREEDLVDMWRGGAPLLKRSDIVRRKVNEEVTGK